MHAEVNHQQNPFLIYSTLDSFVVLLLLVTTCNYFKLIYFSMITLSSCKMSDRLFDTDVCQ